MKTTKLALAPQALLALGRLKHVNLASNKLAEELRSDVEPGQHKGTAIVRLDYDITVGEESEAVVAQSVPWKRFAGALLAKLNAATREAAVRELIRSSDGENFEFDDTKSNEETEALIQKIMGETKKTVAGRITGTATLTPID